MAVSIFWDGEAAPISAVPTVANSGGASGTAMSQAPAIAAGDSIVYTDFPGFPYGVHLGMNFIAAGAGATRCFWAASEVVGTRVACRFMYSVTPGFTQAEDICGYRHASGNLAILQIGSDGKIIPQNAAGTSLSAYKAGTALGSSTLCAIGLAITPGSTNANGRIEWAYWADPMSSGAPDMTADTGATQNVGTNQATAAFCLGRSTGRAEAHQPYYGLIDVETLASGWPGPPTVPQANPIAQLGGPINVEPYDYITLDASLSRALNGASIASYAFSQTAGPSVGTLSGTGSSRLYRAPGVSADTNVTFQVIVTDSNGLTGTATVVHSILQANEYAPVSAALQPLNID